MAGNLFGKFPNIGLEKDNDCKLSYRPMAWYGTFVRKKGEEKILFEYVRTRKPIGNVLTYVKYIFLH